MDEKFEGLLPPEFHSGNDIAVERATITRERMLEIIVELYDTLVRNKVILESKESKPTAQELSDMRLGAVVQLNEDKFINTKWLASSALLLVISISHLYNSNLEGKGIVCRGVAEDGRVFEFTGEDIKEILNVPKLSRSSTTNCMKWL